MPVVTITPKFVNDPKPGKKWGSVKDADNNFYGVPPDYLNKFKVGFPITIQYENGKEGGRFFKQIVAEPSPGPMQAGPPVPNYLLGHKQNGHQRTDDQSYMIFVTGVVGRAMGSGKFDNPDSVLRITKAAHEAWGWIQLQKEQEPGSDG